MTAIELKWLLLAVVFPSQSRKRLHGSSRQIAKQFGEMSAAANATHRIVQALAESLHEICANELLVCGTDLIARAGIRHSIGARLDRVNRVILVDRDAHVHRVNRLSRRPVACQQFKIVIFDVSQMGIDVEQAVITFETFVRSVPCVKALASSVWCGQRHGEILMETMRGDSTVQRLQ